MDQSSSMNIDFSKTTAIKCQNCGSEYFQEVTMIRRMSKIATGDSQDSIIPIPVMRCADCGHVNDELKPNFNG